MPRADAGDDAVVVAAAKHRDRHRGHRTERVTSIWPMPTCAVEHELRGRATPTSLFTLWPLSSWPRTFASPQLTCAFDADGHSLRDDHVQIADADPGMDRGHAGRDAEPREVELEVADAEPVVAAGARSPRAARRIGSRRRRRGAGRR